MHDLCESPPPQPLGANCPFNSFRLTNGQHFSSFRTSDGRLVNLITAIPLYPEELVIARRRPHGFVEL
ncbi:MAG: hypothetical protein EHM77_09245, partial [Planctomycetaceae bacterium]